MGWPFGFQLACCETTRALLCTCKMLSDSLHFACCFLNIFLFFFTPTASPSQPPPSPLSALATSSRCHHQDGGEALPPRPAGAALPGPASPPAAAVAAAAAACRPVMRASALTATSPGQLRRAAPGCRARAARLLFLPFPGGCGRPPPPRRGAPGSGGRQVGPPGGRRSDPRGTRSAAPSHPAARGSAALGEGARCRPMSERRVDV